MKTYKFILAFLIMLFSSQLFPQSIWFTNTVPFTGPNQRVGDASFISADIGYMPLMSYSYPYSISVEIYKTTNKGVNWISKGNVGSNVYTRTFPAIKFINENTGFVVTVQNDGNNFKAVIYKTTNACSNWNSTVINNISLESLIPMCKLEFVNENIGFLSTMYNIYQTTDCGLTWTLRTSNGSNGIYFIFALKKSEINSNVIYATGGKYDIFGFSIPVILKSNDGGSTFQTVVDENSNNNGVKGIKDMDIVNNNGVDVLKLAYSSKGVAEYSNDNLFILTNSIPDVEIYNYVHFWDNNKGVLAVTGFFDGSLNSEERIYKTTDGGYSWDFDNYEYAAETKALQGFHKIGDVFYTTSYKIGFNNEPNTFFHFRKININLTAKSNYITNTANITMQFAGEYYSPLPFYGLETIGGLNNTSVTQYPVDIEDVFYKWNNNNMNPSLSFAYGNPYYIDKGDVVANYKTKLKTNEPAAISNVNQTKSLRDDNGQFHQVHSSMGGIFYSRSAGSGQPFDREEVVNAGTKFLEDYRNDVTSSFGNKNPSISLVKYFDHGDASPNAFAVSSVWERWNQAEGKTEVLCALRSNSGGLWGVWKRFGNSLANNGIITSFNSTIDKNAIPDLYSIYISGAENEVNSFLMIVPHLEPSLNGSKLVVSAKYQNYTGTDYYNPGSTTNDFEIVSDFVSDYSSVYEPYEDVNNNSKGAYIYLTYKKNGNIYYRRELVFFSSNFNGIFRDEIPAAEQELNISLLDNQTQRNTPDITLRNGMPTITYQGRNNVYRAINIEGSMGIENILLNYYPIYVYMRDANNVWTSFYYNSNGFQTQENPDIEGSTNYNAFLVNFSKANNTFYQFVKINGSNGYTCSPGSFTGKDAKLIKGSYIGQSGTSSNPGLLTLSNQANSLYSVGKQPFIITNENANADGFDNMDGTIEKDNTTYLLTLGPIIASNTTYGFEDDIPPQTVHNPVEFNETMVSGVFSLSDNDTLLIGANGKYTTVDSKFQPLKYHVDLINASTMEIHRELFRDTINIEDSVGIEFLRGYIINNISGGTGQFYVQLFIDTTDAEDGEYMMAGAYADDTPPEGDAPMNYRTKVFFENSSNSLSSGNQIPKNYELAQNYPNPFNPVTKINFELPKQGFVTLKIYDITGREIKTITFQLVCKF